MRLQWYRCRESIVESLPMIETGRECQWVISVAEAEWQKRTITALSVRMPVDREMSLDCRHVVRVDARW